MSTTTRAKKAPATTGAAAKAADPKTEQQEPQPDPKTAPQDPPATGASVAAKDAEPKPEQQAPQPDPDHQQKDPPAEQETVTADVPTPVPDASQPPVGSAKIDEGVNKFLRLINNSERQYVEALAHLRAATAGTPSGAAEVYASAADYMKEMSQGVRNAAMNHALFLKDNEPG